MSRHKLYRNYDFEADIDEFDGQHAVVEEYEDEFLYDADTKKPVETDVDPEEEAENKRMLLAATEDVLERLGDDGAALVTREAVEEAVWYYYFDVDKATDYLIRKFIDPPTPPPEKEKKKPKPKPKPKQEPPAAQNAAPLLVSAASPASPVSSALSTMSSFAAFFADMPWLHVPAARQAVFVAPGLPRGGLLGGASNSAPPKMTKLQALAAQRKRKAEEAKKASADAGGAAGAGAASGTTSGGGNASKMAEEEQELRTKTARLSLGASSPGASAASTPAPPPGHDTPQNEQPPADGSSGPAEDAAHIRPKSAPEVSLFAAAPSAFAQALFGPRKQKSIRGPEEAFLAVPSLSRAPESAFEAFLEPSPDDQVLAAQAKAFNKKTKPNASKDDTNSTTDSITSGVKALKVDNTPLPRSKNLNVLLEHQKSNAKPSLSFVVVGHVDSGKSTMMGRLLLDLHEVSQHTIDQFQREANQMGKSSFALAWVLDQGTDEREHGVTIDIATRHFQTERVAFTLLDAPGHRDFIPNMIAGASQADLAVLVVDASPGEFESGLKGQTREHALLLRSMGLSRLIVAVNKLDRVGWSQERFDEIMQQMSGFLKVTGFPMGKISYVPVSGLRGDNLVTRSTDPAAAWYTGGTLVDELEKSEPPARALVAPLRLQISEAFRTAASAVTVGGRIAAGSLQMGDAVLVQPGEKRAYVKALLRESEPADWAVAGHNVLLHLTGIDPDHVRVGDVLCNPSDPVRCVDAFSIKALAFDVLFPMPVEVHRGRLNEPGVVRELTALLHKNTGEVTKRRPKLVKPGHVARLQVTLGSKVPLEPGQRVVLRTAGQTIAAGLLE